MAEPRIILGVTGSIAAYKAPELVRRLKEQGAAVRVVMTESAAHFITPTALQAVSGEPVRRDLWDEAAEAAMGHIELARWADLVLIAPATAEILMRLAAGSAADLLSTLCLATEAPVAVAPAMNRIMWAHPAVQANRRMLEERGVRVFGPGSGGQACGEFGEGRMLEPAEIARRALAAVPGQARGALAGRTVLVTAGPTREAIDPVRFISNRSSGKMGYALAEAARDAGARVILVSGPVALAPPYGIETVHAETADEMFAETHRHIDGVDVFIGAAAISDYRPGSVQEQKIKKSSGELRVEFMKTPDTLASVARLENGPFTVGFAAETERLREHALAKLEGKQLDMIVANQVGRGQGFDCEQNAAEVYWAGGGRSFPLASKQALAAALVALIAERYAAARADQPGGAA
ncbi:MAG TPA: bifunctional phosphopantothenoylcysteine decarboxylase/phosphopantothenate--cysteine ligase CoaBC [Woeseiaceae bacterium]